jgi:hypothetical protein
MGGRAIIAVKLRTDTIAAGFPSFLAFPSGIFDLTVLSRKGWSGNWHIACISMRGI